MLVSTGGSPVVSFKDWLVSVLFVVVLLFVEFVELLV